MHACISKLCGHFQVKRVDGSVSDVIVDDGFIDHGPGRNLHKPVDRHKDLRGFYGYAELRTGRLGAVYGIKRKGHSRHKPGHLPGTGLIQGDWP